MSAATLPDFLIETRGERHDFGAYVVACAFDRAGRTAAFALGDGTVRLVTEGKTRQASLHDGAILSLAQAGDGFATGGDDGKFMRLSPTGEPHEIAAYGMKWVEHVAAAPGTLACAVGKRIHLFDETGEARRSLEHPSSVTGLAFDARGKRLGASHYNGASLWFTASRDGSARPLTWKGSHIGIVIHPAGEAVVTAMQENALHGWRLPDEQHMRMSGYPAKTAAMSFTRNGKWLATSGADTIVLWPFFGGGPMGKPPTELAGGDGIGCTHVACHPQHEAVAAGFADGLVVLADIGSARILPVAPPGQGPITALAWNAEGTQLAIGTERGFAALVDFTRR